MLKKMKEKAGFISIETVIVAGLVIALGAFALTEFYGVAQGTTDVAMDNVSSVLDVSVVTP